MKKLILLLIILISLKGYGQYNPAIAGTTSNKPYAPAQATPTDSRSYYYDAVNFTWRPYQSTSEVLFYLNLSKYRTGQFDIVVNVGGILSGGLITGGVNTVWYFKNGTADSNLVIKVTVAVDPSLFLLKANNLSDLPSIPTAKTTLGINLVDNTSDATKWAATATIQNKTISGANNTITGLPNSALNNSSIGFTTGTSGTDFNISGSPVPLGGTLTLNLPLAGPGVTGKLSGIDWTTFNNKLSNITGLFVGGSGYTLNGLGTFGSPYSLTITGGGAGCLNCNADSLKKYTIDTTSNRNGYALTFDSLNHKWILAPNGSGTGITQLTGDVLAGPGSGSVATILATVNGAPGSFGTASSVASFTVNGKGLIPTAANVPIQIAESQVTNLVTDLASKISLTSLSATSPLFYNNTTGVFTIQIANTSQNGYLSSTDWNTFNGKLTSTLTSGNMFVGNGSNVATSVTPSGAWTITNAGVSTLTANSVVTSNILNSAVTLGKLANGTPNYLIGYDGSGNPVALQPDTLFGKNLGVSGDSLVYLKNDTIYSRLVRDSLGFHHVTNTDGSWTMYATGGFTDPLTTNGDIIARISGSTTRLAQGSNNTFLGVQGGALGYFAPFALTTTGTSGAATFSGGTLNIPQYSGGGSQTFPQVLATGRTFSAADSILLGTFQLYLKNGTTKTDTLIATSRATTDSLYANNFKLRTGQITGDSAYLTRRYVVSIGNSITHSDQASKYYFGFAYQLSYFLSASQVNFGTPGQALHGNTLTLAALVPIYDASKYQAITWEYGTNDANAGVTPTQFTNDLNQVIDTCIIRGWPLNKILIFSVPYEGTSRNTTNFSLIAAAQSSCTTKGVVFVDCYNYMKNNGGFSLVSSDSTHPNDKGYTVMAIAALKVISPSIIPSGWQKIYGTLTIGGPYHGIGKLNVFGGDAFINGLTMGSGNLQDSNSTAIGVRALQATTASGLSNTGIGFQALQSDTSGSDNTAIGANALSKVITGISNTAIGKGALQFTTASNNTAIGANALIANTTGTRNVAIGSSALTINTNGSDNIAIGQSNQITSTGANANISIGNFSMQFAGNSSSSNTAIGHSSMRNITSGTNNFAGGANALLTNTTGNDNTAVGVNALQLNSTGTGNVGVGKFAGQNETGSNKLYIANSGSNNLIYGNFSTKQLQINAAATPVLATLNNFEVNGSSYLSDSLILNKVITGTSSDSVLVINSLTHAVHKILQSSLGGSFTIGTFSNTATANGLDFTTGVLTAHAADGSNAGMLKGSGSQTIAPILTMPAPIFTGMTGAGANDSVVTIDPATGQTHWRSGSLNLHPANGITGISPDSLYGFTGALNQISAVAGAGFTMSLGTTGSRLGGFSVWSTGGSTFTGGQYASAGGSQLLLGTSTINNAVTSTSGSVSDFSAYYFRSPTITSTNTGITYSHPTTLRIENAPTMSTNSTNSNQIYALDVVAGISHFGVGGGISAWFDGVIGINGNTPNNSIGLSIGASTTSIVPVNLSPGVDVTGGLLTQSGNFWNNGTNLYFVDGASTGIKRDISTGLNNYRHTIFTPSTGGTVNTVINQYNIINPAGTLATLTVNLPSSPSNNDIVYIKFTQTVTAVTYANGTVVDGITGPAAGGLVILTYDAGTTSWY